MGIFETEMMVSFPILKVNAEKNEINRILPSKGGMDAVLHILNKIMIFHLTFISYTEPAQNKNEGKRHLIKGEKKK